MNILINAVSSKSGGARTYVENLIQLLSEAHDRNRYIFYIPKTLTHITQVQWADHICVVPTEIGSSSFWKRVLWDQVVLRGIVKKRNIRILISSSDFGMTFCPCPQILLVRNSLFFSSLYRTACSMHKSWRSRLNLLARRWMVLLSVKFTDVVITATQSMLDEMKRFIDLSGRTTVVNPFGVPLQHFANRRDNWAEQANEGSNGHFRLLHVAEYSDYKNLTTLLKAIRVLSEGGFTRFTLLTTADPWQFPSDEIVRREEDQVLARHPMIAPFIKLTAGIPYADIPKLYAESEVFVFPSIAESFGHPLVEAMASGLPIVASDIPVCREICGEAAVYFDPFNEQQLAEAILQLRRDVGLRKRMSDAGRRRAAAHFNWTNHVKRLQTLIEQVGANG